MASVRLASVVGGLTLALSAVPGGLCRAQSDPSNFTTVINVPPAVIGDDAFIGSDTQLNLGGGGQIGRRFMAGTFNGSDTNIEVNLGGGETGFEFNANAGSTVNVSGGLHELLYANRGSTVNVTGGEFGGLSAHSILAELSISGGRVGELFASVGRPKLVGGEFLRNGEEVTVSELRSVNNDDVITGTLPDGSSFVFSGRRRDSLRWLRFEAAPLPPLDLTPMFASTPAGLGVSGLRAGQSLTIRDQGALGNAFSVVDAQLNVEGGSVGAVLTAYDSDLIISGGTIGFQAGPEFRPTPTFLLGRSSVLVTGGTFLDGLDLQQNSRIEITGGSLIGNSTNHGLELQDSTEATINGGLLNSFTTHDRSVLLIAGGDIGPDIDLRDSSTVNLYGTSFALDGTPVADLSIGQAVSFDPTAQVLTGTLADGSMFSFDFTDFGQAERRGSAVLTATLLSTANLAGDFNASGQVEQGDLDLVLQNWGVDTDQTGVPFGWFNDLPTGQIEQTELDGVLQNWGDTSSPDFSDSSVPEPAWGAVGLLAVATRRSAGRRSTGRKR